MLGVLRAALPGAAFAQSSGTLVSLWAFDETNDVGGVFDDLGPAGLPMSIVGSWPDLTTDSIVQGVGGTSAYTDGSAYATIPADGAAHAVHALTISFYYQRHSAAAKQVLLAAGDGVQAGDFSIEVLANGRLRGYHVGQDGVLRFFEGGAGITGTNLQVGTAHRIDLSLGPQGARIYLDGAELTAAAIPANVNGWNNARVKYLGVFPDGASAPAVGAFDRFRLWNRQLANAEIALLEPAQSTILPPLSPAGDELTVPSLAEWLRSDETDPTATKYVSSQNRGNGSGSSPSNAQEVQAALNGASPGDVLLAVCQAPGTIEHWNYPGGLSFSSGSSGGGYVTLQARKGDGVVINAGGDFASARTPGSGFWTQSGLSSADIDKNIWRSVSTFSGGAENMIGWWIEFDHPHQVLRALNMTNLRATFGSGDSPGNYAAPMVHKDSDGRIYIRFQRPNADKYSADNKWSTTTWPGHPEAVSGGKLVYPVSENPNDYSIYLTRAITRRAFNVGSWAKIGAGINSAGFRFSFSNDSNNIRVDRGLHYAWHSFVEASTSGNPVSDYFFNRTRSTDGSKLHASRAEWKFGGWQEGIRSACFRMFNSNSMAGVYCKDCTFGDWHELFTASSNLNQVRFRNCTFVNIFDDGIQTRHNMSRCELGYCYFFNSAYGGHGEGGVSEGDDAVPGNWFIHHNVIDLRQERGTNWRAQPHSMFPYGTHSPDGRAPRKTYNNLLIFGPDCEEEHGPYLEHCPTGSNNTFSTAALMHEVFNNIVIRTYIEGTKRYDAVSSLGDQYSDGNQDRSDYVNGRRWIRYDAGLSNELFDYNLYWRPASMNVDPLLREYARGSNDTVAGYASLSAWHASAEFTRSKSSGAYRGAYSAGFDGNSTDTKPTLASIDNYPTDRFKYRPAVTAAVTVGVSGSLSGANWWSTPPSWGATYFPWNDGENTLAPSAWKGPLDPQGVTLPVGVQNP